MNGSGSDTIPHFLRACMHFLRTSQHPDINDLTGARNIRDIESLGIYEEYRPWYKPEHAIMHMLSYCY